MHYFQLCGFMHPKAHGKLTNAVPCFGPKAAATTRVLVVTQTGLVVTEFVVTRPKISGHAPQN